MKRRNPGVAARLPGVIWCYHLIETGVPNKFEVVIVHEDVRGYSTMSKPEYVYGSPDVALSQIAERNRLELGHTLTRVLDILQSAREKMSTGHRIRRIYREKAATAAHTNPMILPERKPPPMVVLDQDGKPIPHYPTGVWGWQKPLPRVKRSASQRSMPVTGPTTIEDAEMRQNLPEVADWMTPRRGSWYMGVIYEPPDIEKFFPSLHDRGVKRILVVLDGNMDVNEIKQSPETIDISEEMDEIGEHALLIARLDYPGPRPVYRMTRGR